MLSYLVLRLEASILAEPYFDCASREDSGKSASLQLVTKDHVLTHIEGHIGNCKYSMRQSQQKSSAFLVC